jgi:hypothetical protein
MENPLLKLLAMLLPYPDMALLIELVTVAVLATVSVLGELLTST